MGEVNSNSNTYYVVIEASHKFKERPLVQYPTTQVTKVELSKAKAICTSLCFVLLFVQTTHSQENAVIGTCGTEEMRAAAVDEILSTLGCDNYTCGKLNLVYY